MKTRNSVSNITPPHPADSDRLPPETISALLDAATRARQHGNISAARALLRALSAQAPDTPRVWLALALVAETRDEQRRALERVLALEPHNPLAQRGLERMGRASGATAPAAPSPAYDYTTRRLDQAETVAPSAAHNGHAITEEHASPRSAPALAPTTPTAEERASSIRWPLYLVVGAALVAVLSAALLIRPDWFGRPAPQAAVTPTLPGAASGASAPTAIGQAPGAGATSDPAGPAAPASPLAGATSDPAEAPAVPANPTPALPTSAPPTATPSPTTGPTPSPLPVLAPGTVVQQGQWNAVLLRPDFAVLLDGSIGAFQPRGRFLLALITVANDGPAPARIPDDLLFVVDRDGNHYPPQPAISTAYLDAYGRGQRGDLSMEDPIPADGGNKSIPLIFDVPESAHDLYLFVEGAEAGWPIGR
jgi:hypothetical protein